MRNIIQPQHVQCSNSCQRRPCWESARTHLVNRTGWEGYFHTVCRRKHHWRWKPMGPKLQSEVADVECRCKANQAKGWVRSNDAQSKLSFCMNAAGCQIKGYWSGASHWYSWGLTLHGTLIQADWALHPTIDKNTDPSSGKSCPHWR